MLRLAYTQCDYSQDLGQHLRLHEVNLCIFGLSIIDREVRQLISAETKMRSRSASRKLVSHILSVIAYGRYLQSDRLSYLVGYLSG